MCLLVAFAPEIIKTARFEIAFLKMTPWPGQEITLTTIESSRHQQTRDEGNASGLHGFLGQGARNSELKFG